MASLPPPPPLPSAPVPPPAPASSPELQRLGTLLDSMRPDSDVPPAPLADADVTGVIQLAIERVAEAVAATQDTLTAAAARLTHESARLRAVTRALSAPPAPPPPLPPRK